MELTSQHLLHNSCIDNVRVKIQTKPVHSCALVLQFLYELIEASK